MKVHGWNYSQYSNKTTGKCLKLILNFVKVSLSHSLKLALSAMSRVQRELYRFQFVSGQPRGMTPCPGSVCPNFGGRI